MTVKYGGHTSCVCISAENTPPLVFDMGTGARGLGKTLVEAEEKKVYVLLSHTHMDHLYALPYFEPVFESNSRVFLGVPSASASEARERIGLYLNGFFHPLRIDDLAHNIRYYGVPSGAEFQVGPYEVETLRLVHPGGTLGYRASLNGRSVCYVTDTGPLAHVGQGIMAGDEPSPMEQDLLHLVRDADLLIMDAMYQREEYLTKLDWGHSYPEYAVKVGQLAGVKKVALFHHSPDAGDDSLDALAQHWAAHTQPEVIVAREGLGVVLEG
jgi:ribonuclease BN (tRNA processing enzyme)